MDGICTHCGLAYSPDDRECRQCGLDLATGGERRGFLSRLLRRKARPARQPAAPAPPQVFSSQRIEVVGPDGRSRVYDSLDDVPAEDRARLEGAVGRAFQPGDERPAFRSITITGGGVQAFESLDQVPEEYRARIHEAFEQVERMGIDIPGFEPGDEPHEPQ